MRPRVTDNKILYIRFRKDLDDLITRTALDRNMPKATLVGGVMSEYIRSLATAHKGQITALSRSDLKLSPLSSSFFVKHGRMVERTLGKPMRITLKKVDEGNIQLAALAAGYTITQFRTAIMVTWAENEGLLE